MRAALTILMGYITGQGREGDTLQAQTPMHTRRAGMPRGFMVRMVWPLALLTAGLLIAASAAPAPARQRPKAETQDGGAGWTKEADLRKKLAYSLQMSGQIDKALEIYKQIFDSGQADEQVLVRYTWLLNEKKQYQRAWKAVSRLSWPNPDAEILELQANTALWAKQLPAAGKIWAELVKRRPNDDAARYQYAMILRDMGRKKESLAQLARISPRSRREGQARYEQAMLQMDTGEFQKALEAAQAALARQPDNPDYLLVAARAASDLGQSAEAAGYLDRLEKVRKLDPGEMLWLAGLRRRTDNRRGALLAYERAAELYPDHLPITVWKAVGDLRWELDLFSGSLAAYEKAAAVYGAQGKPLPASLHLKMARAAAKADRQDLAARHYLELSRLEPGNLAQVLEAARYLSMTGRHEQAAALYKLYTGTDPKPEMWVEIAQALLAAKQYKEAEEWTSKAMEAGLRPKTTPLLHAQALHYQGKPDEADPILRRFLEDNPDNAEALALMGYVAASLDRNLEAFQMLGKATQYGASLQADLVLWQGISAGKRGDFKRAYDALKKAESMGADQKLSAELRTDLDRQTRASLALPLAYSSDSNKLELWRLGLEGYYYLSSHLPLGLRYHHGEVGQDLDAVGRVEFDRDVLALFMPRFYLSPQWLLEWNLALEWLGGTGQYGSQQVWTGSADLRYEFTDKSHLGIAARRGTFWTGLDSHDPRRYHRIINLSLLDPGFAITSVEAYFLKDFHPLNNHWQINLGRDWYEDDNSRLWLYSHFLMPLRDKPGDWWALQPNIFAETYEDDQPAYFSPSEHVTLGLMLHYIGKVSSFELEAELNPQLQYTEGDWGWGAHGLFAAKLDLDPFYPGIGLFGFYDENDDYWLWRALLTLQIRF